MIKALIFDLDNCLAPSREMESSLYEPAFEAIRRANGALLSEQSLEAAFHDCWSHALYWVAKRHGFSEEMLQAAWSLIERLEVETKLEGYGDPLNPLPAKPSTISSDLRL